jgi:hypothetical protein
MIGELGPEADLKVDEAKFFVNEVMELQPVSRTTPLKNERLNGKLLIRLFPNFTSTPIRSILLILTGIKVKNKCVREDLF